MESKTLIYKNGHFYDKRTGVRMELTDNSELTIVTDDNSFVEAPPIGKWPEGHPATSLELQAMLVSDSLHMKIDRFKKIYDQGTHLYFSIHGYHEFEVELKEDLYVYTNIADPRQTEGKLFDCACELTKNTSFSIDYFEKIIGKSLNEIYKNTFVHYFGNNANPACNALNRFYEFSGREDMTIGQHRHFEDSPDNNPAKEPTLFD